MHFSPTTLYLEDIAHQLLVTHIQKSDLLLQNDYLSQICIPELVTNLDTSLAFFYAGFVYRILYAFLVSPMRATHTADFIPVI